MSNYIVESTIRLCKEAGMISVADASKPRSS